MATVSAGTRLVLAADGRPVPLRVLRDVRIAGEWSVPVLAAASPDLADLAGQVEIPTDRGLFTLRAHLRLDADGLTLRPGGTPLLVQRREDVRAEVRLPVQVVQERLGDTVNVSAGGLGLRLADEDDRPWGTSRFAAELALPDDRLVPVVLSVVDADAALLRTRFEQIQHRDREALVRLVFEQQRRELAARKRLLGALQQRG
jgi:hypothetical protein